MLKKLLFMLLVGCNNNSACIYEADKFAKKLTICSDMVNEGKSNEDKQEIRTMILSKCNNPKAYRIYKEINTANNCLQLMMFLQAYFPSLN